MKKGLIYLILLIATINCYANRLTSEESVLLKKAYSEQNYFVLDNLMRTVRFDKRNPDLVLYKALLDNVFNRPEESNKFINSLLINYPKYFNDSTNAELYSMRVDNNFRLQDYKKAYDDNLTIINKYKHVCDSSEIESYKNINLLIHSLFEAPKMEISKRTNSRIPLKRDKAHLFNIPVTIDNDTIDFVFDTGANFSTITQSLAKKYSVKIVGEKVNIGSANGMIVESEIGLATIKLNNIEVKNVVFLVMPDSALSLGKGTYVIKGIVGFPVIYALQEFTIKDDKYLIISEKSEITKKSEINNFALEGLMPIIRVVYKNDILPFHFDTGAVKTDLFSFFFNKYKNDIIGNSTKKKQKFGSAGGEVESECYILKSINLSAGNSNCTIDSLRVTEKDLMGNEVKYVYGNFGQDYIKQFSEMKMNFDSMSIIFSNKKK